MDDEIGKTVFVGLSGGVDSSVAAVRLKAQGFNVVGVFIKVWHPDWMVCNWEAERLDAMRVAAHLEIPFLTCDAEDAYKNDVADYFISEYQAGRTPNPDVMCNQHVKFGRFLEFAKEHGADYIATGHYAQKVGRERDSDAGAELHRGIDAGKDQTYFLWTLSNEQLAHSLFPIGDTPKEDIRKEAERLGIPVATKKDSQGICFLGHVDIAEFLSHYVNLVLGDVLDTNGEVIGRHHGALVYTAGQRHGFAITVAREDQTPLYVVDRDLAANTITVAASLDHLVSGCTLTLTHAVLRHPITAGQQIEYQIRYRQTPLRGTVAEAGNGSLSITPNEATVPPAAGQSCVLYDETLCIGGGILA